MGKIEMNFWEKNVNGEWSGEEFVATFTANCYLGIEKVCSIKNEAGKVLKSGKAFKKLEKVFRDNMNETVIENLNEE